jgi:hypothetical protein
MPIEDSSQYAGRLEQLMRQAASVTAPEERAAAPEPAYLPPIMAPMPTPSPQRSVPTGPRGEALEFLTPPRTVADTGLTATMVEDHLIRTIYFANELAAADLATEVGLLYQVLDEPLKGLTKEQYLEIKGQRGLGEAGYIYTLTSKGKARALECLQKTWYRGILPVPFECYVEAVRAQTVRNITVTADNIRSAFSDLIIRDNMLDQLGPAVNSGSSLFLFGAPGNGKTAIAERLNRLMGDEIYIPRAVEVDGYVIKLFDAMSHHAVEETPGRLRDLRWVRIKRPVVTVGGELTLAGLDLLWNEVGRFYEAPLQMKANGGIFFIDDFGRQVIRPVDLLNRWIVPLEKRVDYLTLMTGKKIEMPFDELLVLSTNLNPEDLADEAFLRRIKFKVHVEDPDLPQFAQIMQLVCRARGVTYDEGALRYMLETWWRPTRRPLRMCQPRDIVDQLTAIARYQMRTPALHSDLIDLACRSYFVSQ